MENSVLISILVAFVILFFVFLLIREMVCWYWKINRMVELLENIDKKLGAK